MSTFLEPKRTQRRVLSVGPPSAPADAEFAEDASNPAGLTRKEFLRLMSASLVLSGVVGCTRQPPEMIVPYVRQPDGVTPGKPQWFATAMEQGGNAFGLLVKSHEGRPTKIEGNPAHPLSLGRTTVHAQAAVLDLYDPDRSQVVRQRGNPSTWEDFLGALLIERAQWDATGGEGVRLLTGRSTSPTLREQIAAFLQKYPHARWHEHEPGIGETNETYDFSGADVIVSLDADFLGVANAIPRDVARFTERRRPEAPMNRLYVLESVPSLTGAMADHRLALSPSELQHAAFAIAAAARGKGMDATPNLQPIIRDLLAHRGKAVLLAGEFQPPEVHAAVSAANAALGATVVPKFQSAQPAPHDLRSLVAELSAGKVKALLILDSNPVFTAPARAFPALPATLFSLHCGLHIDETADSCRWHVPLSHFLESWSDATASDGTVSIVQPLIEPLYPSRTKHEILSALTSDATTPAYEIIRAAWQQRHANGDFEALWRRTLHDGLLAASAPVANASLPSQRDADGALSSVAEPSLTLLFRPDPHLLDGRAANNAWLQELPKPISRITWGNAIFLSPKTAQQLALAHGQIALLKAGGQEVRGPVWILPGHADRTLTVHLGGGRSRAGRVGNGIGFDAAPLQDPQSPWQRSDFTISPLRETHVFATTQEHSDMAGRDPVRVLHAPTDHLEAAEKLDSLYPPIEYRSPSWGMVIDLSTCIGCGVCTIACQAENNIPVVGRDQVIRGREMHWIRVDRYFDGAAENPRTLHQPVPCMHCENAPCEVVCPVAATVHDHQGLNLMVYNRCVGTRYCSNNCPYKVRRFNFFQYVDEKTPQLKLQRNPEVTVRSRGVMEKCTYCVQRISAAQITTDVENRAIRDGEVVTACAQACPANAITFGDILNPASRITAQRGLARNYALLAELNARPRTTYLAKALNLNPEMPA